MFTTRKVNYLNNKDMLREIHRSKNSYCWFKLAEYGDYDIIVSNIEDIPNTINPTTEDVTGEDGITRSIFIPPAAKVARAKRLTVAAQDAAAAKGIKLRADEVNITHETILDTDIIFRVMTWAHIPEAPTVTKIKKGKKIIVPIQDDDGPTTEYDEIEPVTPTKYVKVNFKPFEHYKYNDVGELELVGRSHWKGDLENGSFSKDHGTATNKLALMYMKLCERYATRGNWRNYSYNEEMRSQALLQLAQVGLQFDEAKSDNPFGYFTQISSNAFCKVLNAEKRNQTIRDDILEMNDLNPSYSRMNNDGYNSDD